jgi:dihydropteroate synthase
MGIINLTPDSFYQSSRFNSKIEILTKVEEMLLNGCDILDLGAMSSRPGSVLLSIDEEIARLGDIVSSIKKIFPDTFVSVDTFRAQVAKMVLDQGADIINDIYAGTFDTAMFKTIADYKAGYIMMHMQGNPANMQLAPKYEEILSNIISFFIERIKEAHNLGLDQIILDPGFGFGKTINHNYELLNNMSVFNILNQPVLAGLSRKSMIYKVLKTTPQNALNGTSFLYFRALEQGTKILRVHDVKEAKECISLFKRLNHSES